MRKPASRTQTKVGRQDLQDYYIEDVRFWRECPEEKQPVGFLPLKLVFTEHNINGLLVFLKTMESCIQIKPLPRFGVRLRPMVRRICGPLPIGR